MAQDELLKKVKAKRRRTVIIVVVVALFALSFVVGTKINKASDRGEQAEGSEIKGTVTMTIECKDLSENLDTLKEPSMAENVPKDGIILDNAEYKFKKDETVFDALTNLAMQNDIPVESKKSTGISGVYIKGIGHIYEFDAGKRSGWLYEVNGEQPDYSCSKYDLVDGQDIRWYYTVDYTKEDGSM